jgi:hypothetical protein
MATVRLVCILRVKSQGVQSTAVHKDRTLAVVNCEVRDPAGKLVAQATGSALLPPGRLWDRPVQVADELTD